MNQSSIYQKSFKTSLHLPQIPKQLFAAKPAYLNEKYEELDRFRIEIEQSKAGLHHQPYTANRKNVNYYKTIFFAFFALFLGLGIATLTIPTFTGCSLFISTCTILKGAVVTLCAFLSTSSLAIALTLKAEREAVLQYVRKTRAQMGAIFARKRIKLGLNRFLNLFGKEKRQSSALHQLYHEAWEKVIDIRDETLHLVNRISTAKTLDKTDKEQLLNQAVEEMHEKLRHLVHSFRHAASPYYGD